MSLEQILAVGDSVTITSGASPVGFPTLHYGSLIPAEIFLVGNDFSVVLMPKDLAQSPYGLRMYSNADLIKK